MMAPLPLRFSSAFFPPWRLRPAFGGQDSSAALRRDNSRIIAWRRLECGSLLPLCPGKPPARSSSLQKHASRKGVKAQRIAKVWRAARHLAGDGLWRLQRYNKAPAKMNAPTSATCHRLPLSRVALATATTAAKLTGHSVARRTPGHPPGRRKGRSISGLWTRSAISARNSSSSPAEYSRMSMTTSLVNGKTASNAEVEHTAASATAGMPVVLERRARSEGSQPSRAMAYGSRDAYSNWLLKSDQAETRAMAATSVPSHGPATSRATDGHPADSFH